MFNLFRENINDIQCLLDTVGKDILINNSPARALITNPTINNDDYDDRYISALDTIKRGDLISYSGNDYLIITETVAKRANKYKAIMRNCNHTIQVAEVILVDTGEVNYRGEPIYETTYGDPTEIPCIVDNSTFSVSGNNAIKLEDDKILTTTQDNATTRGLKVNDEFEVMDRNWKILNIDKTKVGLLIFTCQGV